MVEQTDIFVSQYEVLAVEFRPCAALAKDLYLLNDARTGDENRFSVRDSEIFNPPKIQPLQNFQQVHSGYGQLFLGQHLTPEEQRDDVFV
jgi:hypothetical protein